MTLTDYLEFILLTEALLLALLFPAVCRLRDARWNAKTMSLWSAMICITVAIVVIPKNPTIDAIIYASFTIILAAIWFIWIAKSSKTNNTLPEDKPIQAPTIQPNSMEQSNTGIEQPQEEQLSQAQLLARKAMEENAKVYEEADYQLVEQVFYNDQPLDTTIEQKSLPAIFDAITAHLQLWVDMKGFKNANASIQMLAREFGTNNKYLSRYFNEVCKVPFRTYLNTLRMDEMQRLLEENPKASIDELAMQCGFFSRSNFNRVFKAHTGMTPSQWKARKFI